MQCSNPNSRLRFWLVAVLILAAAARVAAQRPFAREYWLNEAATPVHVNALAQDAAGYIWLGTDAGLYRFNGSVFVPFQDSAGAPVTAVAAIGDFVWVGFKNGSIGRVEHERSVSLIYKPTQGGNAITSIYPDSRDNAIATTEDQLLVIRGKSLSWTKRDTPLLEGYIYSLTPLSPQRALVASDAGLTDIVYSAGQWKPTTIDASQGLPDAILRVLKPVAGTNFCWLGTQQGGVALYDISGHTAWVPYYAGEWIWGQVNDILPVSRNKAYAVTESGYMLELFLADSTHLDIKAHHYPGKTLTKLLRDKTGNLWCATGDNILKISAPYAGYMPLEKPYSLAQLTAMACDREGRLWLAQDNHLYMQHINDTEKNPRLIASVPSGITSLFVDHENRLWVGTLGDGLWSLTPGNSTIKPVGVGVLRAENILSIAGTDKSLWVASLSGVHEVSYPDAAGQQDILRHHTKASGMGSDYVYQIYPDSKGRIWLATDGAGVIMYDGSRYHKWDGEVGIKVAYSITEDAQGDIWATTLEKGLYCYHAGAWRHYGREEGLQETSIASLSATRSGMIVAVNRQGIDQWYPGSRQFRHYNRRLGIDIDSTSPVLNCITRDAMGSVYVPFEHGIITLKNEAARFDITPGVRIAQVALFMVPLSMNQQRFASNENYLTFFFDGVNYGNPEAVNFRYKLQGYNNSWIQTADNRVTFPRLPSGRYTFRLQGSLNQHFTQSGEASYSFSVAQPLWRRTWFIILCVLLLGLLIWYLVRLRDKSVNNLLRLQQERLAFEYEHLKSQVNPHFLFNSLNTLTGLIEDGERESATAYTAQLSDLYRNMLAYRDRDLIFLSEELDILAAYLHIQRCRFEDAFEVNIDIPDSSLKTKKIVPMSLQLLVENAIKHNVVSKSRPLVIHIRADEANIMVTNPLIPKLSPQKGAGVGLRHICRRYELLSNRKVSFGPVNGLYQVNLPLL